MSYPIEVVILYNFIHSHLLTVSALHGTPIYHCLHGMGVFGRLIKSTKDLLRKELKTYKLHYAKLQTLSLEVETIVNNRPLTY